MGSGNYGPAGGGTPRWAIWSIFILFVAGLACASQLDLSQTPDPAPITADR